MSQQLRPTLLCIGLNHRTASLIRREESAFDPQTQVQTLQRVRAGEVPGIHQLVILSTCNRTELYAVTTPVEGHQTLQKAWEGLETLFQSHTRLSLEGLRDSSYCLSGLEAVWHLFQVAAGLDSVVIGEPQILGQLVRAYEQSRLLGTVDSFLSGVMQRAIRAGKRVRHETPLQTGAISISTVAVRLAQQSAGSLTEKRVLVIGAGKMARLAASALARQGIGALLVSNRSPESGAQFALEYGGQFFPWERLSEALTLAQVVISAFTVDAPRITPALLRQPSPNPDQPKLIIDLGLPRSVDPAVGTVPHIKLYDLGDLRQFAVQTITRRSTAIAQAEALLCEELQAWERWQSERSAVPAIRELYQQAQKTKQAYLLSLFADTPNLSPDQQAHIARSIHRQMQRGLHPLILNLKARAAGDLPLPKRL